MQALEHTEQLVHVLHVEAGAVVPDHERPPAVRFGRAELDPRPRLLGGVFPAVAQQILERDAQQGRIGASLEPRGDHEFHSPGRIRALQLGDDLPRHAAHVHNLGAHLDASDPCEFQQIVDQGRHALAGGAHAAQRILSRLVQLGGVVFQQYLAEPIDAAQRGAEVVGHRVGERVELLVGGEQLGRIASQRLVTFRELVGPRLDALLEVRRVAPQLAILVLDAPEHLVERVGQRAQFVLTQLGRPHGVVLPSGDRRRRFRQGENGR